MEALTVIAVKQRYNAATWKERIAACRSSGHSVANWCTANGVNSKSYYRWERKLLREAGDELSYARQTQHIQRFAEIPAVPCTSDVVSVLRIGGITCELCRGISPNQLSAIVQVMKDHA